MTNTYPFILGILLCMSALGIYIFGNEKKSYFHCSKTELILTLICSIVFALIFEKTGTIKASFIFSFILGTIWNRKVPVSEESTPKSGFIAYLTTNTKNIAENILASCISSAGIWLVFERIFRLSLP